MFQGMWSCRRFTKLGWLKWKIQDALFLSLWNIHVNMLEDNAQEESDRAKIYDVQQNRPVKLLKCDI